MSKKIYTDIIYPDRCGPNTGNGGNNVRCLRRTNQLVRLIQYLQQSTAVLAAMYWSTLPKVLEYLRQSTDAAYHKSFWTPTYNSREQVAVNV